MTKDEIEQLTLEQAQAEATKIVSDILAVEDTGNVGMAVICHIQAGMNAIEEVDERPRQVKQIAIVTHVLRAVVFTLARYGWDKDSAQLMLHVLWKEYEEIERRQGVRPNNEAPKEV